MSSAAIRKYILVGISLLLLILIGFVSCKETEEDPTVTPVPPTDEPTPEQGSTIPDPGEFACSAFEGDLGYDPTSIVIEKTETNDPFVPSQIIITGIFEDINRVLQHEDIIRYDLSPALAEPIQIPPLPEQSEPLVSNLYAISTEDTVPDVIQAFYQVVLDLQDPEQPIIAFAQPNLLVASPLGIDADPLGIDADPLGIDADALSGVAGTDDFELPGETAQGPWNQWALSSNFGISLYNSSSPPAVSETALNEVYGDGIDVYIFDTSPFAETSEQSVMDRKLCVYHPQLVNEIKVVTKTGELVNKESNIKQHGYFSAGLVRFVAPNSQLHLIRVLNDQGVGDIFSYIVVLNDLLQNRGDMQNSVINLSLSLHEFDDEDFLPEEDTLTAILDALPDEYDSLITNPEAAISLVMDQAFGQGAVIVAASGNDSDLTASPPEMSPTGIPANYVYTVGVAGSDIHQDRACFSNDPEMMLLAPSGDGIDREAASDELRELQCEFPFPWLPEGESCPPSIDGGYDCKYALTSVVTRDVSESGFAHWLGTSFATPLVSGTAALMLDAGRDDCTSREIINWLRSFPNVVQIPLALDFALDGC